MRSRSLQRRADIREAGAQVLARFGGEGAMGEIGRAVGLRPGSITNFYPRKDDLTFDILHAHFDGLMEHVGTAEDSTVAADGDPCLRLTAMVRAWLDYVLAYRDEQRVAITLLDTLPSAQRDPLAYQARMLVHRLAGAVTAAVPALAEAPALRQPATLGLVTMLNGAALWFRDDGALSRDDLAALLVQQTVAGLRAMLGVA
jgi:AcrR family transcriptional regulator